MDRTSIALRIKRIREFRNYTQAYVARKLSIKQNTYSSLERGTTEITRSRLEQIALILNFPLVNILRDDLEFFNPDNVRTDEPKDTDIARIEGLISALKNDVKQLKEQNDRMLYALQALRRE